MDIKHESRGTVMVVAITGSLDALTAPQLTEYLTRQLGEGHHHLVVDLAGLEYTAICASRRCVRR